MIYNKDYIENYFMYLRFLYLIPMRVFTFCQSEFLCRKIWRCPTDLFHTWPRWQFYKWVRSGPRTDRTDTDGAQPSCLASSLLDNTGRTCRSRSCVSGIRRHLQFSHLHRHLEKFIFAFVFSLINFFLQEATYKLSQKKTFFQKISAMNFARESLK